MTGEHGPWRVMILGAAGRDFHNFNVVYRDNADVKVTAAPAPMVLPPRDGTYLKHRFREALLGERAFE